jgi:hypothetical protein
MTGIKIFGYLGVKNSLPAPRIFAMHLLRFVRELLVKEAVRRGYAFLPNKPDDCDDTPED